MIAGRGRRPLCFVALAHAVSIILIVVSACFPLQATLSSIDPLACISLRLLRCATYARTGTHNRKPETSGMLRLCDDLDVRVLAYSPLAQGLLTGKYSKDFVPR